MTIEFTNVTPPKGRSAVSTAIVVTSCLFFFIPTTLIVLGYLASRPTGTLISPLPQGIISLQEVTSPQSNLPIIAAPSDTTPASQSSVLPSSDSNITDQTATISAGLTEVTIQNQNIRPSSQIYITNRPTDKSIYSVKNKADGQVTISVNTVSDLDRYIDYHIVNP